MENGLFKMFAFSLYRSLVLYQERYDFLKKNSKRPGIKNIYTKKAITIKPQKTNVDFNIESDSMCGSIFKSNF